jgi:hypothetical protein
LPSADVVNNRKQLRSASWGEWPRSVYIHWLTCICHKLSMQWVNGDMIATELEALPLTSTDYQEDVVMAAAQPSKASKAYTPVPVFHPHPYKEIPVNGSTKCCCGRRTRTCKTQGRKYFCEHGRQKSQCTSCGTGTCEHGRVKSQCTSCGTGKAGFTQATTHHS